MMFARLARFTAVALVALATTQASAAGLPKLLSQDFATSFSIAPRWMILSGDGAALLAGQAAWIGRNPNPNESGSQFGHLTWTSWTTARATAIGVYWQDNCTPNCAQGTYFPTDEHVVASRVQSGVFTRLLLTPTVKGKKVLALTLGRAGNGWVWNT